MPDNPGAWLTVSARRRAIDRIRRERGLGERMATIAIDVERARSGGARVNRRAVEQATAEDDDMYGDDRLRLLFTCCHPALAIEARVALTLRAVGGLSTDAIAHAFLVPEPTMAQRLVRAKRKIAAAGIPYRVPADEDLPDRLAGVLSVLYLVFNEGYEASSGQALDRPDVAAEAIRLARLLRELMPDEPEVMGLLALMLLTDARRPARLDADGAFVPLSEQDRTLWSTATIDEGVQLIDAALRRRVIGPYQLQATIAALHSRALSAEETDWAQIALLYGELCRLDPSPVIVLNRAAALMFSGDLASARTDVDALLADPRLSAYVPLHATDAELHRRAGAIPRARTAFDRAIEASANRVQIAELTRRRDALDA